MKQLHISKVAFALTALTLVCFQSQAKAGGEGFSTTDTKDSFDTKSTDLGLGKFSSNPFHVSVTVRGGYDDNVDLSSFNERGSAFTNVALTLDYNFGSPRTKINVNGGISATYYWDNEDNGFGNNSDDWSVNAWVGFSLTHRATPRLTLTAQGTAAYLSRPGFDTFNSALFIADRRNQNFFQTTERFGVGYAWAPRFATATSYTLSYVDYDDAVISRFEDRFEHTFANEFRFLLMPTTTIVAEYRFGIVDYIEDSSRDSYSHFFLAGFDHSFSPRFNVSFRGGLELREFCEDPTVLFGPSADDSEVAPYAEATINYAIAQRTSLTWFNRYSLEQPNVPDALSRETFRTHLSLRHAFTARISAGLSIAYQHDSYNETFALPSFDEDSFDIGINARYAINRNWSIDVGYQHTEVISDDVFREFARNQIYAGATFSW